jgi:mannosyltransferase
MHSAFFTRHRKLGIFLTIIMCYIGVCAISFLVLIHQSLRLDESQSLWQTSHSIGGTLRVVAQDVHVPLYHLSLHFWQLYFGNGVATARVLSLIFFLITIPLVYLLARQVLEVGWALFSTIIFSFLPFMDWYSNEARMYTLLAMMATLSQLYFLRIIKKKPGWWGYGITSLIGAYSHYFFSFNLATQGVFYLFNRRRFAPGTFKRLVFIGALVILALLPWLIYFHSLGSGKNTSPQLTRPSTVDFFNVFSQFLFGFQDNKINTILVSCWPLTVLLAFFAIKRGQRISLEISYLITAALVPVIMAYLLSFVVNPFFLSRYMISCVAPLVIVIVWLISNYRRRFAYTCAALIVVGTIFSSIQQDSSALTPVKENYREVAQTINREATPSDIVVLSAPFTVYPFEYYYTANAQIDTLPIWNRQAAGAIPAFNKAALPSQVNQIATNHRRLYLVLSQNQGYENTIKQYFLHHYPKLYQKTYSPDLTLYVFKVGYNVVPPLGSPQTIIKSTSTVDK